MKKTDVAMIFLIAGVSAVLAYVVANSFFGGLTQESARVKTVDAINSSIQQPSVEVFNEDAINPAVKVNVNGSETDDETP
jgi:hypothetical protein